MRFLLVPSLVLLILPSLVAADTSNFNPTGARCVDPSGYLSCYAAQNDNEVHCKSHCDSTTTGKARADCYAGCLGFHLAGNVGCWIQSCWNMVYSCEYQKTAISYLDGLGLVYAPDRVRFFPPPPSATEGVCACNLGYAYDNETTVDPGVQYCDSTNGFADVQNCLCCKFSLNLSNMLDTCGSYDLTDLAIADYIKGRASVLKGIATTDKCGILDTNPGSCSSQYGLPFIGKVYNALNLPSSVPGTKPLTNAVGNARPSLKATETFTMFPGFTSTIIPVALNGGGATGTAQPSSAVSTGKAATGASDASSTTGGAKIISNGGTVLGTVTGAASTSATQTKASVAGTLTVNYVLGITFAIGALMYYT